MNKIFSIIAIIAIVVVIGYVILLVLNSKTSNKQQEKIINCWLSTCVPVYERDIQTCMSMGQPTDQMVCAQKVDADHDICREKCKTQMN